MMEVVYFAIATLAGQVSTTGYDVEVQQLVTAPSREACFAMRKAFGVDEPKLSPGGRVGLCYAVTEKGEVTNITPPIVGIMPKRPTAW